MHKQNSAATKKPNYKRFWIALHPAIPDIQAVCTSVAIRSSQDQMATVVLTAEYLELLQSKSEGL
jgi:hypothetical protein